MMMPVFSYFDAISAEIFGQKLSFSKASSTQTKQQQGVAPIVSDRKTVAAPPCASSTGDLKKAGKASPPSSSQQKRQSHDYMVMYSAINSGD
ncbi:hypothetical protein K7X08_024916 [Anisodus acutangulus]|uniref:Uncharacterized protein n=1 Tax=Anisodus acutangulus TaxID=402998 RepID=A0A9Q1M9R8_9SOLA|nr:hypothetical protein K7X08_024916 [Anisodus acutangulus]